MRPSSAAFRVFIGRAWSGVSKMLAGLFVLRPEARGDGRRRGGYGGQDCVPLKDVKVDAKIIDPVSDKT